MTILCLGAALPSVPGVGGEDSELDGTILEVRLSPPILRLRPDGGGPERSLDLSVARLYRFGVPDAGADELASGEHVRVRLQPGRPGRASEIRDDVTVLLAEGRAVEIVSVDTLAYTCRVRTLSTATGAAVGPESELQYGKDTVLILGENASYIFRRPPGRVWANTGLGRSNGRMLRDVLDEASLRRYQAQQRLRAQARKRVADAATPISWKQDVQPFLAVNCRGCHENNRAQSGFSVSGVPQIVRGGRRGAGLVPGKPQESLVYLVMTGDRNPKMPPDRDPIPEELTLFRRWIEQGARAD